LHISIPHPTRKMTVFGAIFEVNCRICKLGHFDKKKYTVDFNEYHFFVKKIFYNVVVHTTIV